MSCNNEEADVIQIKNLVNYRLFVIYYFEVRHTIRYVKSMAPRKRIVTFIIFLAFYLTVHLEGFSLNR
jgi:hypothetical protein